MIKTHAHTTKTENVCVHDDARVGDELLLLVVEVEGKDTRTTMI